MKYQAIVSGHVLGTYETKEEAEKEVTRAKNSYLALVHPVNCFFVKVIDK
jgi:hypothetical protein